MLPGTDPAAPAPSRPGRHAHVLTPGDHYSPRTGSATATVVRGLLSAHLAAGGSGAVAVARGTYPDRYPEGEVVQYDMAPAPTRSQQAGDVLQGWYSLRRRHAAGWYRNALSAAVSAGPDVVVLHNATAVYSELPGRPAAVLYCHNDLFRTYGRREAQAVAASFDRIVCVSDFLAERVRKAVPAMADRVHRVHNGVDAEQWKTGERAQRERLRLLFVGRVIPEKGAHLLLDALARTPDLDVTARIVGSQGFDRAAPLSSYERSLRRRAAALRQEVTFSGFVDRPALVAEMHQADLLVVPSDWDEPFCLTVLEGMAAELPVVAAAAGGLPEAAGGAAVLVPRGEVGSLADALVHVVTDDAARRQLALASAARAAQMTWSNVYPQLLHALRGL
jgi:glycosyltransferase involved in cell wall biosynthesis